MRSREESEQKLEVVQNGRSSIRGGHIKEVHFLPDGDNWRIYSGSKSMTSNTRKLKQVIGVDRTTSIRETESEKRLLEVEMNDLSAKEDHLSRERHQYKVQWNNHKKDDKIMRVEVQDLEDMISRIQLESAAAENVTVDTKPYEDDVREAESAVDALKERQEAAQKAIEELQKPIAELQAKVDETQARNEKVANDLNDASQRYEQYIRSKEQRDQIIEKKRHKLAEAEKSRNNLLEEIEERARRTEESKYKAQRLTYQHQQKTTTEDKDDAENGEISEDSEDAIKAKIEAIEPIQVNKESKYYRTKIQRGEKEIEQERKRRQITEVDPEVALMKYKRAKKDLDDKIAQLQTIEENEESLVSDLRTRRKRWREFRGGYTCIA